MSLIDIRCTACESVDEVYRAASDWPKTPPCPSCGGPTEQIHLPKGYSFAADPVVVYQAPDGSFRYPGDTHGASAAKYDTMGYTRLEARSFAEVRALERRINEHDRVSATPLVERSQARRESQERSRRSELFHHMASFSPQMRDLARAVIDRNNRKPGKRSGSGSTHVEAYS